MVHSAVLSSIPRRCRSIPSVHFRTRLEITSLSAQCIARGRPPSNRPSDPAQARFRASRFISLAGVRPMRGKRNPVDYKPACINLFFILLQVQTVYARSTRPDFKQDVQTYIFLDPPSVFTLTDFTFDFHIFGVFL